MDTDSGADDAAALRARVAQLEQTVAEQQQTIESLSTPTASRRGVLAALTGVAGAGALGAYSQRGAAQAAGQVGTQSEPVDVEAWSLNVQDQLAGDLDAGGNDLTNVGAVETGEQITNGVKTFGYFLTDTEGSVNLSAEFGSAGGTLVVQKVLSGSASAIYGVVGGGSPSATLMTSSNDTAFGTTQGGSDINVYADGDIFAEITDGSSHVTLFLISGT